jgi:hypothetical protein
MASLWLTPFPAEEAPPPPPPPSHLDPPLPEVLPSVGLSGSGEDLGAGAATPSEPVCLVRQWTVSGT